MPDGSPTLIIAIVVLVLLSGFFSATETAYTSLNVIKIKSLAQKDYKYKKVLKLYEEFDRLITTILVGNNIVNLTASSLAVTLFMKLIPNGNYTLVSTAVITVIVLLFGEIAPKFIAKVYPEKFALLSYPFIKFFYFIFFPVSLLLSGFRWLIMNIFKLDYKDSITDEELLTIVNEAEEDGTLKQDESDLIRSAIEFDDLEVRDILVPRINVVAVDIEDTIEDIKKVFDTEAYSRLPVYKDNIDGVVGIIHQKDFYQNYNSDGFTLKSIIKDAVFVVEHTKISALLRKLQATKTHIAVVLDEYGGTLGIVTVEDIIEELVGEIYDEYDEEVVPIRKNDDGSYLVIGSANLDDFFETVGIITEDEFDANTVNGWVTERLEELPQLGKKFEYKNIDVEVTKISRKKVLEIKVWVKDIDIAQIQEENE